MRALLQTLKHQLLALVQQHLLQDGVKKFIVSQALSYLKLGGFKGMIAKLFIQKIVGAGLMALEDFVEKVKDDNIKEKYADEMAKGKDADEQTKIDSQLDIINGPR